MSSTMTSPGCDGTRAHGSDVSLKAEKKIMELAAVRDRRLLGNEPHEGGRGLTRTRGGKG